MKKLRSISPLILCLLLTTPSQRVNAGWNFAQKIATVLIVYGAGHLPKAHHEGSSLNFFGTTVEDDGLYPVPVDGGFLVSSSTNLYGCEKNPLLSKFDPMGREIGSFFFATTDKIQEEEHPLSADSDGKFSLAYGASHAVIIGGDSSNFSDFSDSSVDFSVRFDTILLDYITDLVRHDGYTTSVGYTLNYGVSTFNMQITTLDQNGNHVWTNLIEEGSNGAKTTLKKIPESDEFVVLSVSYLGGIGGSDLLFLRIKGTTGDLLDSFVIGGDKSEYGGSFVVDAEENYYYIAFSSSFSDIRPTVLVGKLELLLPNIIKYKYKEAWTKVIDYVNIVSIDIDQQKRIYLAGYKQGNGTSSKELIYIVLNGTNGLFLDSINFGQTNNDEEIHSIRIMNESYGVFVGSAQGSNTATKDIMVSTFPLNETSYCGSPDSFTIKDIPIPINIGSADPNSKKVNATTVPVDVTPIKQSLYETIVCKPLTNDPTQRPSSAPIVTASPSNPTFGPTYTPSKMPSKRPSDAPTSSPSKTPTESPSDAPTNNPSLQQPTPSPTEAPLHLFDLKKDTTTPSPVSKSAWEKMETWSQTVLIVFFSVIATLTVTYSCIQLKRLIDRRRSSTKKPRGILYNDRIRTGEKLSLMT